uniref:Probable transposase n=1 Tax=Leptospirillum ferrodiazotrophum TaxID=412449 RepID=C6HTR7_9BACT|nr:MAG: probable transposase [Leptospirillum ferrodiazotrophum]
MLSLLTTITREDQSMYTVIDLLRDQGIEKGIEKGRQEGRQEGLQQGRQEDIEKLLSKGILSPPEIASVLEVDRAWVEEIAKHIAGRK